MLSHLTVENYALIEHLELDLDPHLNIITGETGAGKSILLGAIGLLLGAKNDGAAIKDSSRGCIVEGIFNIEGLNLEPLFGELDIEYDGQTVIRRIITPSGKSRAFVNDVPVQLTQLRELGAHLIDIHSQHQTPILSSPAFRMRATDTMAGTMALKAEYTALYESMLSISRELQHLQAETEQGRRDEEWLRFQVEELEGAALHEDEVARLEAEQALLASADTIGEMLCNAASALNDEETGVLPRLKSIEQGLLRCRNSYHAADELAERLHSTLLEIKDIEYTIASDAERIESDPARLEAVDMRLATLWSLCRKHHAADVAELIAIRDNYKTKLDAITYGDERMAALEERLAEVRRSAEALAERLHTQRAAAIEGFGEEMSQRLSLLGMPDAVFNVVLEPTADLTPEGKEEASFVFTANKNMAPQPIERIASGGEMSRMMLSLKSLLARRMNLPAIIFDEIDTGVSGRIADAMGEIIADLSESMQVVNITHLPQVASKGSAHFVVYKEDGRSNIRRLNGEERITEIAKMLSGSDITEAAILQARHLLAK